MNIVHIAEKEELENQLTDKNFYKPKGEFIHMAAPNSIKLLWPSIQEKYTDPVCLIVDDMDPALDVRYEKDPTSGIEYPHIYNSIPKKSILEILPAAEYISKKSTRHVLLNTSMIDEKWIKQFLRKWISPKDKVCVLAMSYFDDTKNLSDWNRQFSSKDGCWYKAYQDTFYPYSLKPEQIIWINPFTDSNSQMKSKLLNSNIVMLPGGAPDLFMKRLKKAGLKKILAGYQGLMIGVSAGSMIQLGDYHISPDEDYPAFSLQKGLGTIPFLDLECHYTGSRIQKESIDLAREKLHLPVYAIYEDGGVTVDENGKVQVYGRAEVFE